MEAFLLGLQSATSARAWKWLREGSSVAFSTIHMVEFEL